MKRYHVTIWTNRQHVICFSTNSFNLAKTIADMRFVHIGKVTDRESYDIVYYRNKEEL